MEMFRPLVKTHKCIYLKIEQEAEEEYEREIIKKNLSIRVAEVVIMVFIKSKSYN